MIARWSAEHFGEETTARYFHGLQSDLSYLLEHPTAGQLVAEANRNLRRYRYKSHNVFYYATAEGILISRVLHTKRFAVTRSFPQV